MFGGRVSKCMTKKKKRVGEKRRRSECDRMEEGEEAKRRCGLAVTYRKKNDFPLETNTNTKRRIHSVLILVHDAIEQVSSGKKQGQRRADKMQRANRLNGYRIS